MAYDGSQWDEANPTNSTLANEIDDVARDIKIGVRSRMQNEHIWPAAETGTGEAGFHTTISLQTQTATPSIPVLNGTTQAGVVFASSGYPGALLYNSNDGILRTVGYPTGVVLPFAGTSTMPGTYFCDGSARSRTTDATLFNKIGTLFGTGDGTTTFNLPNPAGMALVGLSGGGMFASVGTSTGEVTHTLTLSEMPAHTHAVTACINPASGAGGSGSSAGNQSLNTDSKGGGAAHNNVQPSMVFNMVIGR